MYPFIASQKMREESQVLLKQIVEVREWECCALCLLISFSFLDWVIYLVYVLTGQKYFFEHQSPTDAQAVTEWSCE